MFDPASYKTPLLFQSLFPSATWNRPNAENKTIFLTFDDGPIPKLTTEILQILKNFNAKASFFCVGENIVRNPTIFHQVVQQGHSTGNHTYNHLKAWQVNAKDYLDNIEKCQHILENENKGGKRLFRPPYGQISPKLVKTLLKEGYELIMWDVLSKDYLPSLNIERAFSQIVNYSKSGSIIVFHDNIKAGKNVLALLPMYLKHFSNLGYKFASL